MSKVILITAFIFAASTALAGKFSLTSDSIKAGGNIATEQVFNGFGCSGKNISPDLKWSGEPKDTKYFALTMYDPDAPTGSGWWHWIVYNIPAATHELKANAGSGGDLPSGAAQAKTDFGKPEYGGPCPPAGDKPHHYVFTLTALKNKIDADQEATAAYIGFNINSNKIGATKLTATYGRSK